MFKNVKNGYREFDHSSGTLTRVLKCVIGFTNTMNSTACTCKLINNTRFAFTIKKNLPSADTDTNINHVVALNLQ